MRRINKRSEAGFTLVELLVVVAIMGLVVIAVLGLYTNMQRNTGTAEEVVEVQSGLRVGLDWIARDLRMAGIFIIADSVFDDAQGDRFTVSTATSYNVYARIGANTGTLPALAPGDDLILTIDPPGMLDLFKDTGEYVRILRPATSVQPVPMTFRITAIDGATISPRTVTLTPDPGNVPAGASLVVGDMLVRVQPPANLLFPHTITYALEDDTDSTDPAMLRLMRSTNFGESESITGKITQLQFVYILKDGSTAAVVPVADRAKIVAVRVMLTGATDASKTGQANYAGVKTRQLETIVKLRNL